MESNRMLLLALGSMVLSSIVVSVGALFDGGAILYIAFAQLATAALVVGVAGLDFFVQKAIHRLMPAPTIVSPVEARLARVRYMAQAQPLRHVQGLLQATTPYLAGVYVVIAGLQAILRFHVALDTGDTMQLVTSGGFLLSIVWAVLHLSEYVSGGLPSARYSTYAHR